MTNDQSHQQAIARIRAILADDRNYQTDSLKLGGIWDVCDKAASYKRGTHSEGSFIEVMEHSAIEPDGQLTIVRDVTTVSPNFRVTATVSEPKADLPDWDRVLRSSVPERWKDCASAVGAVQSYIAELEQRLRAHGEHPLDEPSSAPVAGKPSDHAAEGSRSAAGVETIVQGAEFVLAPVKTCSDPNCPTAHPHQHPTAEEKYFAQKSSDPRGSHHGGVWYDPATGKTTRTDTVPEYVKSYATLPVICGKPMPNGKGARECINVPGHDGDCDDMPF